MVQGGGSANSSEKDALSNFRYEVWAHCSFYCADNRTTLDKEFAICKKCLVKVKFTCNTANM